MVVEIRELHVKVVAGVEPTQNGAAKPSGVNDEEEREALIALCVERVMEVLKREEER